MVSRVAFTAVRSLFNSGTNTSEPSKISGKLNDWPRTPFSVKLSAHCCMSSKPLEGQGKDE
jgi:hypothetical protein